MAVERNDRDERQRRSLDAYAIIVSPPTFPPA